MILAAAVAAIAVLLLAGCHEGNRNGHPTQKENVERADFKPDSLKDDSMKTFYRLIPRRERIHGGMGLSESDI